MIDIFKIIGLEMSLNVRFIVTSIIVIVAVVATMFVVSCTVQNSIFKSSFINKGVQIAQSIADEHAENIFEQFSMPIIESLNNYKRQSDLVETITVIDYQDNVLADFDIDKLLEPYNADYETEEVDTIGSVRILKTDKDDAYVINAPAIIQNVLVGQVYLKLRPSGIEAVRREAKNRFWSVVVPVLLLVFGVFVSIFLGNIFIKPIRKLSTALERVSEGDRPVVDMNGALTEFGDIGNLFNDMVNRIREQEGVITDQTRIKKEMQLAKDIQDTLLPKTMPKTEGYEISGSYRSALEMGGDYYDYFRVDKHTIGLVVGDVSGKGVGAAMVMAVARTALRAEARGNKRAADVLAKINAVISDDMKRGMYITMFYLVLDSKKRLINYSSAGHNPMIVYRATQDEIYMLNPKGFAVGLQLGDVNLFRKHIKGENLKLAKGDLIFVYTDGITEAMNNKREQYGEMKLIEFIKNHHMLSTEDFSEKFNKELDDFIGDYPQSDDITYLVIKEKRSYEEAENERRLGFIEAVEAALAENEEAFNLSAIGKQFNYKKDEAEEVWALYQKKGKRALKLAEKETESVQNRATVKESSAIQTIIREYPEYGAKRIMDTLKTKEYGAYDVTLALVNNELKALRLNTKDKRVKFAKRKLGEYRVHDDAAEEDTQEGSTLPSDIPPPPDFTKNADQSEDEKKYAESPDDVKDMMKDIPPPPDFSKGDDE